MHGIDAIKWKTILKIKMRLSIELDACMIHDMHGLDPTQLYGKPYGYLVRVLNRADSGLGSTVEL